MHLANVPQSLNQDYSLRVIADPEHTFRPTSATCYICLLPPQLKADFGRMNLPPSKREVREQLEEQMRSFLDSGGAVEEVPRGASGRDQPQEGPKRNSFVPSAPSTVSPEDQVPLTDVIRSIEARRGSKPAKAPKKKPQHRPKRKLVYDDFGEPLRWEWVND